MKGQHYLALQFGCECELRPDCSKAVHVEKLCVSLVYVFFASRNLVGQVPIRGLFWLCLEIFLTKAACGQLAALVLELYFTA